MHPMFAFCADHDKIASAFNTECVGCQMQGTPYGLQTLRGLRERPEAVGGGECIRHRPEQPRPARGIPLNRDARYDAPPMGLQQDDASDGDGVVLS